MLQNAQYKYMKYKYMRYEHMLYEAMLYEAMLQIWSGGVPRLLNGE